MNFDYAAVTTSVTQLFGTNQDVGKGIAGLLVDKLVSQFGRDDKKTNVGAGVGR